MISITEITIINTSVVTIDNSEVTWKKAMTNIICAKNQEGAWSILMIMMIDDFDDFDDYDDYDDYDD